MIKPCQDCHADCDAGPYARWCPDCRWRYRGKPAIYVWTAERDDLLRARYDGRVKGRAEQVAQALGWPKWVITRRAAALGLTYPADFRDWTPAEVTFLADHAGHRLPHWIARKLGRSHTAVVMKLRRLKISRILRDGYGLQDLEACFGVDHHVIDRWVEKGWLTIRQLSPGVAKSKWYVSERRILAFLRAHPMAFRLDKVDQLWFMDLMLNAQKAACKNGADGEEESALEP